jgi:hypothetical protein
MPVWLRLSSLALGVAALAAGIAGGCASGSQHQGSNGLGGGGNGPGSGGNGTGLGNSGGGLGQGGGPTGSGGGAPTCADYTKAAKALPAAMMFVLDMSASMKVKAPMNTGTPKYQSAIQAILTAIDNDAFDNTGIGILTFPTQPVCAPSCYCGTLSAVPMLEQQCLMCTNFKVSCGFPTSPQVVPTDSGTQKTTDTSGVRHTIATYLQGLTPTMSMDDGSPDYEALEGAYAALTAYPNVDKRFAILVSDGGFSCTSLSNPMRPGYSDGACPDWEEPDTVNALISGAYTSATTPINTFIVGVPGSNTDGGMSNGFANAPYPMLLALSTYAVSGSPNTVDPTCDKNAVFSQNGSIPTAPCHIDLSNGSQFTADALANAIGKVRGQALGCLFDLPDPPPGKTINPNLVNVLLTINSMPSITVPKRSNPNDMCATSDCWDYNGMNQVQLIGKACSDLTQASTAKVEIEVGCKTILN